VVLVLHMPEVTELATIAREGAMEGEHLLSPLKGGDLLHPSLGLVVLLTVQVLNVYKPTGMTRFGRSRQETERGPATQQAARA
jgi:hypothetical protein